MLKMTVTISERGKWRWKIKTHVLIFHNSKNLQHTYFVHKPIFGLAVE